MSLFRHNDYRDVLREALEARRKTDSSWSYTRLAGALRVQKTYVSRVLKKDAHLSSDQLFLACEHFGFGGEERRYLALLLEHNRSSVPQRRKALLVEIHRMQSEQTNTRSHLRAKMVEPGAGDRYAAYYLDPLAPLVHTYLTLPEFARNPEALLPKLGMDRDQLLKILTLLKELGIIAWNDERKGYRLLLDHLQLSSDSPVNMPYQLLFRLHTLQHIKRTKPDERFLFSVTFSGNEETRAALHEQFLKFLKTAETIVKGATSERVYQMNFDLFPWEISE